MSEKMNSDFIVKPNPDQEIYKEVTAAVMLNDGHCCCELQKNEDTLCLCKNFREEENSGFCHCGRFYKVKRFPTIAVLCSPDEEDIERAQHISEDLTLQGFIVLSPLYGTAINYALHSEYFEETQKAKIYMADIVLVLNTSQAAVDSLEEQINWATELQKKIVYEHNEEVEE